jgi:sulfite reductase alpha subunit-like flavoprotein
MRLNSEIISLLINTILHGWQGENPKKPGSPHNVRLYSIASTRYGDFFDGKTASLCVRRAVYYDPETGKEDPSKNGVCSNFLCDSKPGDKIKIAGNAKHFLLGKRSKCFLISFATSPNLFIF